MTEEKQERTTAIVLFSPEAVSRAFTHLPLNPGEAARETRFLMEIQKPSNHPFAEFVYLTLHDVYGWSAVPGDVPWPGGSAYHWWTASPEEATAVRRKLWDKDTYKITFDRRSYGGEAQQRGYYFERGGWTVSYGDLKENAVLMRQTFAGPERKGQIANIFAPSKVVLEKYGPLEYEATLKFEGIEDAVRDLALADLRYILDSILYYMKVPPQEFLSRVNRIAADKGEVAADFDFSTLRTESGETILAELGRMARSDPGTAIALADALSAIVEVFAPTEAITKTSLTRDVALYRVQSERLSQDFERVSPGLAQQSERIRVEAIKTFRTRVEDWDKSEEVKDYPFEKLLTGEEMPDKILIAALTKIFNFSDFSGPLFEDRRKLLEMVLHPEAIGQEKGLSSQDRKVAGDLYDALENLSNAWVREQVGKTE